MVHPLIIGNQTLYCVYNDADPAWHVNMRSPPPGIEVQQTVFGWSTPQSFLQNALFIRWLIINKNENDLDSTYITIWSDPDLGDSGDDFVGCDTTLSLGYCYNSINSNMEYGENPPAVGFQILQGPMISSTLDSAYFMGRKRSGYKNLPMTSFVHLVSSDYINGEMQSAKDVYNYMQAHWLNGQPITYGGQVVTLVNTHQEADIYEVTWDACDLASGIYFVRLTIAQYTFAKKLLLMK